MPLNLDFFASSTVNNANGGFNCASMQKVVPTVLMDMKVVPLMVPLVGNGGLYHYTLISLLAALQGAPHSCDQ